VAPRPVFLSYALSFVNVGIYWTNHQHLMHAALSTAMAGYSIAAGFLLFGIACI
jgi:uncharacterized membrane protein